MTMTMTMVMIKNFVASDFQTKNFSDWIYLGMHWTILMMIGVNGNTNIIPIVVCCYVEDVDYHEDDGDDEQNDDTLGLLVCMVLWMLMRTRKMVTNKVILPGMISGFTRKLKRLQQ